MSCVHGEIKIELDTVLVGTDLVLRVSCVSCADQSFIREANGSRYALDHKEWVRHGPWRAGLSLGDGKFDARLHVLDTEQDSSLRQIPLDRAIGFRVGTAFSKPRILVDVVSWSCHHTVYLQIVDFPSHQYAVCTNCWTGCALPSANSNVSPPIYINRTVGVGAIWWTDNGRKSASALPIARLSKQPMLRVKGEKGIDLSWIIAKTADNDIKLDEKGEPILISGPLVLSPELFNFGGRRFGKLS